MGDGNQEWRTTENTESTYSKNSDQQGLEQENGMEEAMLNDDLNSALMGVMIVRLVTMQHQLIQTIIREL